MEFLDGWAMGIGNGVCRYVSAAGHDSLYRSLCNSGPSAAGWRLVLFVAIFACVSVLVWRMFRPAT
jgi:hypothetical protein